MGCWACPFMVSMAWLGNAGASTHGAGLAPRGTPRARCGGIPLCAPPGSLALLAGTVLCHAVPCRAVLCHARLPALASRVLPAPSPLLQRWCGWPRGPRSWLALAGAV